MVVVSLTRKLVRLYYLIMMIMYFFHADCTWLLIGLSYAKSGQKRPLRCAIFGSNSQQKLWLGQFALFNTSIRFAISCCHGNPTLTSNSRIQGSPTDIGCKKSKKDR